MLTAVIFSDSLRMLFERIVGNGCFRSNLEYSLAIFFRDFLESFLRYFLRICFKVFESVVSNDCLKRCLILLLTWFLWSVVWEYAFDSSFQRLFWQLLTEIIQSDFLNGIFHMFFKQSLSKCLSLFLRDCFERFGLNEVAWECS